MTPKPTSRLSVIVPAYNGGQVLSSSLTALCASDLPRADWELIVVDDASTDNTAELAEAYADELIRLDGAPRGPAYARNRGSEAARAAILVFVDADVCVHPYVLRRFLEALTEDPGAAAVFGAYDTAPAAPGFVSQYRNLLHHAVHAGNAGEADTFWAGCGAVRRADFNRAGGFDAARYDRPQIEDIALGYRLRALGCRIVLRPDIQATHLKRWTLRGMIRCDLFDRGIPWMHLLMDQKAVVFGSLNVRLREKLLTVVAATGILSLIAAPLVGRAALLALAAACVLLVAAANAPFFRWLARIRNPAFALGAVPLHLLHYTINAVAVAIAMTQRVALRSGTGVTSPVVTVDAASPEAPLQRQAR